MKGEVECRVVMVDYTAKMVMMSHLEEIVNLSEIRVKEKRGDILEGFKVIESVRGGYIVESEGVRVLLRKKEMDNETQNDVILANKKNRIERKVKLIEFNYLDVMWVGMAR